MDRRLHFSDGSANPPSAIYGTDTAFATAALLNAFALTGETRYRDTALAGLDHYRAFTVRNAKGLFVAYSDQPDDRIPVYATSALLMGQYVRAGALVGRQDLTAFADELFASLWSEKWDTELGAAWPYSATNPFWNDAANGAPSVSGSPSTPGTGRCRKLISTRSRAISGASCGRISWANSRPT